MNHVRSFAIAASPPAVSTTLTDPFGNLVIHIHREPAGAVRLDLSTSSGAAWTFHLSQVQFRALIEALSEGKPSDHGHKSLWRSAYLRVHSDQYPSLELDGCTVAIVHRFLVLSYSRTTLTIPQRMLNQLVALLHDA